MRAHMNCIENLPLYTALVVALIATGMKSPVIDRLAIATLAARIGQTVVHIACAPTNGWTTLRFILFTSQIACMIAIGIMIAMSIPA